MVSGGRKLQNADRQMSEAFITSIFLAMSGGFQDAYTYFTRDEVFSNAQTGNVVLMSQNFMTGQWGEGLRYLFPILAFAIGVVAAERIQSTFKYAKKLHWRQMILLIETTRSGRERTGKPDKRKYRIAFDYLRARR